MECHICKKNLNTATEIETCICDICRKKDLFITKTDAKKKYKLKDDDLNYLFSYQVVSRKYVGIMITLYVKTEVKTYVDIKYGGDYENIKKENDKKKKERQEKKIEQEEKKIEQRKIKEKLLIEERKLVIEELFNKYNYEQQNEDSLINNYKDFGLKIKNKNNNKITHNFYSIEDLEKYVIILSDYKRRKIELYAYLEKTGLEQEYMQNICDLYIQGGFEKIKGYGKIECLDDIINYIEKIVENREKIKQRREELLTQLKINDLIDMKNDNICNIYINCGLEGIYKDNYSRSLFKSTSIIKDIVTYLEKQKYKIQTTPKSCKCGNLGSPRCISNFCAKCCKSNKCPRHKL
jgi:hypothetical protein